MDGEQQSEQRRCTKKIKENVCVKTGELMEKLKEIIQLGNATRIRVKHKEKYLIDIPVTVGAVGAILSPYVIALGVITALVGQCSLEIEREES